MNLKSPITNKKNIILIDEIETNFIINKYKEHFNIDVYNIFKNIKKIQRYKCLDSGFVFFYPFNVFGRSDFYEKLGKYDWYYMDEKWEHSTVEKILDETEPKKILEIGCGSGSFVKKLNKKNKNIIGLEINDNEIDGKLIINETIEEHSKKNKEKYDIVMSFQVLEHISEPLSFIKHSIETLKKNGLMIISVPNNDSFIKENKNNILNIPPHHMGQWNIQSLIYLSRIKELEMENIILEPLQKYHNKSFYHKEENNLIKKIINKTLYLLYKPYINKIRNNIIGHSVIAIYRKK